MDKKEITRKRNKIIKETKGDMQVLGVYRKEFDNLIKRYADMRFQYEIMHIKWLESGCKVTEEYTNKAGATNYRKSAFYLAFETLRKELIEIENTLGLTPKGLKVLKAKGLEKGKVSKLAEALNKFDKQL